jgi:hypothetical protein
MVQKPATEPAEAAPVRRNRTEPLAREARQAGAAAFSRAGFRDPTLVLHWDEIAGAQVAQLAKPLRMSEGASGGVLTLKAEPGASLFLQHESRALCGRINAYLGREAVVRLRFVQGPLLAKPGRIPSRPRPGRLSDDDPALAYEGPERLRGALLNLAKSRRPASSKASD